MAMVCIASALTTQPSTGFIFGLFLIIYFLLNFYIQKGSTSIIYKQFALQSGGLILAVFLFWLPMIFLYGTENITKQIGLFKSVFSGGNLIDTSGGVIYSLRDFVFVTVTGNKIDQPVGIGTTVFVLLVIGVVFYSYKIYKQKQLSKENKVLLIWIVWFFFTLLGIQGNGLPIKLFPHRFWVYMALAIAVIVGCVLDDFTKFIKHNKKTYSLFFLIIIVSLYYTSIKPKIAFQTSEWPPSRHQWMVSSQLLAYLEFSKLDGNVPVLSLCANNRMDGLNFISYDWQPDVVNLKERIYNGQSIDSAEFDKIVNKYNYKYITTDYTCLRTLSKKGKNEAIFLMTELNKNLSRSYSFTNYGVNMLRTYNTK